MAATCSKSSPANLDQGLAFKVHIPHQKNKYYSFIYIMSHQCFPISFYKMYSYQKCFTAVSMVSSYEDGHINVDNVPLLQRPGIHAICIRISTSFVHILQLDILKLRPRGTFEGHLKSGMPWHTTLFTEVQTDFGNPLQNLQIIKSEWKLWPKKKMIWLGQSYL